MTVTELFPSSTPADQIARTLRELRIALHAREVFAMFPELKQAAEGLAWHITDRVLYPMPYPYPGRVPLLHVCIKDAFEWFNAALEHADSSAKSVQTAFISGLMFQVPELIHIGVSEGEVEWSPIVGGSLTEWLVGRGPDKVEIATLPPERIRSNLGYREIRLGVLRQIFPNGTVASINADLSHILMPPDHLHPSSEE